MEWLYEKDSICSRNKKGDVVAEAAYTIKENGEMNIEHVFVNRDHRGQGLAFQVMEEVVKYLREKNMKTTATCPYAKKWLKENREENIDIISSDFKE